MKMTPYTYIPDNSPGLFMEIVTIFWITIGCLALLFGCIEDEDGHEFTTTTQQ